MHVDGIAIDWRDDQVSSCLPYDSDVDRFVSALLWDVVFASTADSRGGVLAEGHGAYGSEKILEWRCPLCNDGMCGAVLGAAVL